MQIDGISGSIEIMRSKRKTLSVQIRSDGSVIARAPIRMPESEIAEFLSKKSARIEKYVLKAQENNKKLESVKPFTEDELREMADKARRVIPERVKYYSAVIGVTYGKITIRNQKTKWGSCSSKGNLNFNCLLMMAPSEVLDAIVVHELCHRKHMNHSKEFYAEVYRAFPEYDVWNKWLKDNGTLLIRRMEGY